MEITSIYFGLLSIIAIFIYYLLNDRFRVLLLVFLSCLFIASFSYCLLIYITIFALVNYYLGRAMYGSKYTRFLFRAGVLINLLQLFVLKYASFTFDPLFNILDLDYSFQKLSRIIIPVGISFFTLQGIGYLVNIKMKWEKPETNFTNFILYIIFYPKFLSGPVERSNHFLPQIKSKTRFDQKIISDGLTTALVGVFKKVVIANQLAPFVSNAYVNLRTADGSLLWILFFIQPLYLYFDFSGYTDIALGLARTFGFNILPNFNRPFLAENMTGFWKRFHISLSSWFNDYVFKQVSFKYRRWGIGASVFAVFLTWILFGVWHGAGWNFMLLGLLQAIAIIYEFFTKEWRVKFFSVFPLYLRKWLGRSFTYLFFAVCMIFFFSPDINSIFEFFLKLTDIKLFTLTGIKPEIFLLILFFMFVILFFEVLKEDFSKIYNKLETGWKSDNKLIQILRWALLFFMITLIIVMNNEVQQFIYFQF